VTYKNIEANDTFTVSHVHRGAAGINGPVRIFLASSLADFNVPRKTFLLDSLKTMLVNDQVYVNAHTKLKGGGKIRGQIR
jgi:CHRD domain